MVWYIEVGEIFLEGPRKSVKGPWEMIRNSEFEMSLVCSKSEYYVNVILRCTALRDHSLNWTLRKVFFLIVLFLIFWFDFFLLIDNLVLAGPKKNFKQVKFSN